MIRSLACAFVLLLLTPYANADWQSRSWSRWDIDASGAEVVVGIERIELQRAGVPDDPGGFLGELDRGLSLRSGDAACRRTHAEALAAPANFLVMQLRYHCTRAVHAPVIRVRLLQGLSAQPLHHAAITYLGHRSEALLTQDVDEAMPAQPRAVQGAGDILLGYLALGFWHILEGVDHLAFLLCLMLGAKKTVQRAWMVTGFTLGHSITLSLSALGLLRVQTAGVEALIGFTVALLAAEVWQRAYGGRTPAALLMLCVAALLLAPLAGFTIHLPALTAAALVVLVPSYLQLATRLPRADSLHFGIVAVFGLIHGLGFASALRTIGLPEEQRGWALAGFNLGVEVGQLALLAAVAGILATFARVAGERRAATGSTVLSGLLFSTGLFWLVERSV